MKPKVHAIAGCLSFAIILTFWSSTVATDIFGSYDSITTVKNMILKGMFLLVPAIAITGASGFSMGARRKDAPALAKKKRMPFIAANGLLVLVPSAIFLASKANAGEFDTMFYAVQMLELAAGLVNLSLMGLNIRDGVAMGRKRRAMVAKRG